MPPNPAARPPACSTSSSPPGTARLPGTGTVGLVREICRCPSAAPTGRAPLDGLEIKSRRRASMIQTGGDSPDFDGIIITLQCSREGLRINHQHRGQHHPHSPSREDQSAISNNEMRDQEPWPRASSLSATEMLELGNADRTLTCRNSAGARMAPRRQSLPPQRRCGHSRLRIAQSCEAHT